MDLKQVSGNSLSFIGDAVFTLRVRQFFIENGYYDMVDLDIVLEEHGLPCIIK